ncbi:MAG: hypothetical protein WC614_10845 [bacterium]
MRTKYRTEIANRNFGFKYFRDTAGSCEIGVLAPNRASYRRSETELVVDGDLDTSKIIIS